MIRHDAIRSVSKQSDSDAVWSKQNEDDKLSRLVERLIHATGVGLADRITVAGRKTLSVFVGLCERRFLRVKLPHRCRRSSCGGE